MTYNLHYKYQWQDFLLLLAVKKGKCLVVFAGTSWCSEISLSYSTERVVGFQKDSKGRVNYMFLLSYISASANTEKLLNYLTLNKFAPSKTEKLWIPVNFELGLAFLFWLVFGWCHLLEKLPCSYNNPWAASKHHTLTEKQWKMVWAVMAKHFQLTQFCK